MKDRPGSSPLECVDPALGDHLWKLQRADLQGEMRARLEAHVSACDACREIVQLDARLRAVVRDARLRESRPRRRGGVVPIATLALAASLAGVLLLPPRPVSDAGPTRGVAELRFTRPVEGEVVAADDPVLRWTPVEGATRYVVEIRDHDGHVAWTAESDAPEVRVPPAGLERGSEYRALLYVRPADLAPPTPASVVFRKGSRAGMLVHRVRWAPPWLQGLATVSLGVLVAASRRRRAHGTRR